MIHNTAIIHPKAKLANNITIGPHTIIGEFVSIGANTKIGANCVIDGYVKLGKDCSIFTGAVIGVQSQDKKYKGGDTFVEIGDRNTIREYVTINSSTDSKDKTIIGNDNFIMAYSHIAHDCKVSNNITMANNSTLAGHVIIEDRATIGGLSAVHQFVRVGKLSIIGGCSKAVQDVIPFSMCDGHPIKVYGINSLGLNRAGIKPEVKSEIRKAFKILFSMKLGTKNAIEKIKQEIKQSQEIDYLINFISSSERGIAH